MEATKSMYQDLGAALNSNSDASSWTKALRME